MADESFDIATFNIATFNIATYDMTTFDIATFDILTSTFGQIDRPAISTFEYVNIRLHYIMIRKLTSTFGQID